MASFARLLILGVCLLLAPAAVRAQDYDLYTASHTGVYYVDLTSGWTQQVLDFTTALPDKTWMNAFLYVPEESAIYATGATMVPKYDCYFGLPKGDFWITPPFSGWKIDTTTWTLAELPELLDGMYGVYFPDIRAGEGVYYETPPDDCDTGPGYIRFAAYDAASGWLYRFCGPANSGLATRWGHEISSSNYRTGQGGFDLGTPGIYANDGLSSVYSAAVDPVDASLWDLTWLVFGSDRLELEQRDSNTGEILQTIPTTPGEGAVSGSGPIIFYPGTHALYRYSWTYGSAWLDQLDLTTGQPTRATPSFDAPAQAIFFLPRQ